MAVNSGAAETAEGTEAGYLPNFCNFRMVFAVVITAELLAIILTLASIDTAADFADDLSLRSLHVQWIALVGAATLCLLRGWISRFGSRLSGLVAWGLIQMIALLTSLAALQLVDTPQTGLFLLKSLSISAIVSALVLRYLHIQMLWRRQVEAESQARFQALQSRIRPHFLFNSMNTIASLTRSDPELAEGVVQDLSDLFRASLSDAKRMSSLGEELELSRGYLRIESQRLGARLQVIWDLEALPEAAPLPALILQPLLENAIYHGIEPSTEPGTIKITGRYRRKRVNLSIRNSQPNSPEGPRRKGNRMALENVRQRLQGFFDDEASLSVANVDGEHQVRVAFPYPWNME